MHGNSCLHYIALFDNEDFINSVFNQISKSQDFGLKLRPLIEQRNREARLPMDFFMRGKTDSFGLLNNYLEDLTLGQNSIDNIS